MAKRRKSVSAETLLQELDKVLQTSKYYQSRESGKRFYDQRRFPSLLASHIAQSGKTVRANAYRFGMSPGTLEKIMAGGPLSDNMLFRIRSALVAESSARAKQSVFPGDWRKATPAKVSAAIADVSDKLVFLKKVIDSSNFLKSEDSPIDKIQVLQLVALLTTALEALRAPFVDKKPNVWFLSLAEQTG